MNRLVATLMLAGTFCVPAIASEEGVRLTDGAIEILFADARAGFACTGIVNRVAGSARFVRPADFAESFWVIKFAEPGGKKTLFVDNTAPALRRSVRRTETGAEFTWTGVSIGAEKGAFDVVATVTLDPNDRGASAWRLKTTCRSTRWTYQETRFPALRSVVPDGAADVMMPAMSLGAKLVRGYEAKKTGESFTYPGWYPMVGAYFLGDAALYLGAHDGAQLNKTILFRKNGSFQFLTEARDSGVVGKSRGDVDYPVVVAVYKGDWWPSAKRYRAWALRQKWARKGPKATRADYPKRLGEASLWHIIEGEAPGVSNFVRKVTTGEWAGFRALCEWTKWHYVPFDANYPDLRPARKGVKETAEWALGRGVAMMPYSNGRVWAKYLASFAYARNDATVNADGTHFIERYAKRDFVAMCPSAAAWQRILETNTLEIVRETGAGAIYLDQIACSGPRLCHNPAHGHPLGGGSWWADGYRTTLAKIHAALSARDIPMTSEGAGDAWLDVIDGYLLANEPADEDIPWATAVYSDYASYFGTPFAKPGLDFDTFFRRFSRRVLWGVQPGWCFWLTYVKFAEYGKILRAAAKLRSENLDFLAYGELIGELTFAEAPEVYATRWRAADGRTAVMLANGAAVAKTVSVDGVSVTVPPHGFATSSSPSA